MLLIWNLAGEMDSFWLRKCWKVEKLESETMSDSQIQPFEWSRFMQLNWFCVCVCIIKSHSVISRRKSFSLLCFPNEPDKSDTKRNDSKRNDDDDNNNNSNSRRKEKE